MNVVAMKPAVKNCPICGGSPYVEEVEPWNTKNGPAPWAAGCYRMVPFEHFVGVNGDTERDAIREWNTEAGKIEEITSNVSNISTLA